MNGKLTKLWFTVISGDTDFVCNHSAKPLQLFVLISVCVKKNKKVTDTVNLNVWDEIYNFIDYIIKNIRDVY